MKHWRPHMSLVKPHFKLHTLSFHTISKHVEEVGMKYKIEKALHERGLFIAPVEIVLGTREERKELLGSTEFVDVLVEETMLYIPLGPLLYQILKQMPHKSIMCSTRDAHKSGIIADFTDTASFS
jgi:hypothetical protein